MKEHHGQLCAFLDVTCVGGVLRSVNDEDCEEFFSFYLHDYIRSMHTCTHDDPEHMALEYKVSSPSEFV